MRPRLLIALVLLAGALATPAGADESGASVLMAIEAARHAQTDAQRWQAALRLESLADADAPGAASALATLINNGSIEGSDASARRWAKRGHELGEADATLMLARMWAEGVGGEQDLDRAAELAREAAVAGLPAASVLVYELLADTNQKAAGIKHLMNAAERGYPEAQLLLGMHLAAGEGVERNYGEAYFWLVLAQAHGAREAEPVLEAVASKIDTDRQMSMIEAALEWEPQR